MTADQLITLLATVTLIAMMVTTGLSAQLGGLVRLATDWRLLLRAIIANYLIVPAAAVGLLAWLDPPALVAVGFLIVAACPGAPYGPPFTAIARGNVPVAVALMVTLAASSAFLAPLLLYVLLPMITPGLDVQISLAKLMGTLAAAQLLPLCLGLAVGHRRPRLANALVRPGSILSSLLNIATFAVILTVHLGTLLHIRPLGYVGMLALVGAGLGAGWVLGGTDRGHRTAMAMATSVRNVGLSMVIATGSFPGSPAVSAATAFAVFQTIVIAIIALTWGRLASTAAHLPVQTGVQRYG